MRDLLKNLLHRAKEFLRPLLLRYRVLTTIWTINLVVMAIVLGKNLAQMPPSALTFFYGQTVVGYYALPMLLIAFVLFVLLAPLRRTAFIVTGTVSGLFLYYLFLDSLVYAVTRVHIDFFWLEFLIQDFGGLGFPGSTIAAAVGVFLLSLAIQVGVYKFAKRHPLRWPFAIGVQVVVVLAFALGQFMHIVAYKQNDNRITALTPHYPLYMPFTSHSDADRYGNYLAMFGIGDARASQEASAQSLYYPRRPMEYDAGSTENPPNILLILLESWRYDVITPEISPRINELANSSLRFENHISSGNQTTCGLFGIFYGMHANYWTGVKANNAVISNPVLIDRLQDLGYGIGVYANSNFERHKVKDTTFAGIEVHEDFGSDHVEGQDANMTRMMIEFIDEQTDAGKPWFTFGFYKATHYSYYYPQEHRIFNPAKDLRLGFTGGDTEPEKYWNDYCNAVHYNDALVGELLDHLEETGQLENTIVILTTDHGEEFNDNKANYWGHGSNFTRYQVQVPLIMSLPGVEPARVTAKTGHIDIVPTVMARYLGAVNDPGDYSSGRDLLDDGGFDRPFVVGSYFNHAFVIGDDVYDVGPTGTQEYKFGDIGAEGGDVDGRAIQRVRREMHSFYEQELDVATAE